MGSDRRSLFLIAVLGETGAGALMKAASRAPELGSALWPRTVLAWLNTVSGTFEGALPGVDHSYVSFVKSESGYTGAVTIGEELYRFEKATVFETIAAVAVALDLDHQRVPGSIRGQDLERLGKSIDLMARARVVSCELQKQEKKRVQSTGTPDGSFIDCIYDDPVECVDIDCEHNKPMAKSQTRDKKSGQYSHDQTRPCVCGHVNHTAARKDGVQPCIGHEFGECEFGECDCESYRPARKKGFKKDELEKKGKSPEAQGTGMAHAPQPPEAPTPPTSVAPPPPAPKPKMQRPKVAKPAKPAPSYTLKLSRSEALYPCPACGLSQMTDKAFSGCLCLRDLSKSVKVLGVENEMLVVELGRDWDPDAIGTLLESIGRE